MTGCACYSEADDKFDCWRGQMQLKADGEKCIVNSTARKTLNIKLRKRGCDLGKKEERVGGHDHQAATSHTVCG